MRSRSLESRGVADPRGTTPVNSHPLGMNYICVPERHHGRRFQAGFLRRAAAGCAPLQLRLESSCWIVPFASLRGAAESKSQRYFCGRFQGSTSLKLPRACSFRGRVLQFLISWLLLHVCHLPGGGIEKYFQAYFALRGSVLRIL